MNLIFEIPAIVWLIGSAIFFAFGEFLSKKFALAPSLYYVIIILIVYSLGVLAWLPAILEKNQLSIVGAIWSVLSLLATILIGLLIFKEKLNAIGIIGIIFALIAVALLSMA
jgi:multidrug transporter EmrE-like cation transporter